MVTACAAVIALILFASLWLLFSWLLSPYFKLIDALIDRGFAKLYDAADKEIP